MLTRGAEEGVIMRMGLGCPKGEFFINKKYQLLLVIGAVCIHSLAKNGPIYERDIARCPPMFFLKVVIVFSC